MSEKARQHRFSPPPGACDMLLIRHGETQAAVRGQSFAMVDGQGDPALRPEGEAQAREVAAHLGGWPIAAIVVTKMRRTHQTAAPLAERLNLAPTVDPDLHEVHLGDWDGGEYRFRAAENDPAFLRARAEGEWGHIPGAETTAQLQTRVRRGLMRVAGAHPDRLVAVVVHGGVVDAAMCVATGARPLSFAGAANGSISRLVIDGERMIARGFNDVGHLAG
ncbi:histidine phosphatase family protein [Sulfitobacter albidus]|uniref:Histidine phosphatase family protein n=1 Tax=Sulfitobacter albidus TaxID=2829501 RepID=A0A975PPE7_9RHOB|nr:histidine phosphatase family protein [Sulfitobacter albidus]QUJ78275.1 histidine phosphatase family protein [Sulfitobacter albidus]